MLKGCALTILSYSAIHVQCFVFDVERWGWLFIFDSSDIFMWISNLMLEGTAAIGECSHDRLHFSVAWVYWDWGVFCLLLCAFETGYQLFGEFPLVFFATLWCHHNRVTQFCQCRWCAASDFRAACGMSSTILRNCSLLMYVEIVVLGKKNWWETMCRRPLISDFESEDTWRLRPYYWRYSKQHVTYTGTSRA